MEIMVFEWLKEIGQILGALAAALMAGIATGWALYHFGGIILASYS